MRLSSLPCLRHEPPGERAGPLDISCDLAAGEAAVLVLRYPSGALTFHAPQESTRRSRGGSGPGTLHRARPPGAIVDYSRNRQHRHQGGPRQGSGRSPETRPSASRLPRLARAFETVHLEEEGAQGTVAEGHAGDAWRPANSGRASPLRPSDRCC